MSGFSKSGLLFGLAGILTYLFCQFWIVVSVVIGVLASIPLIAFGIRGFANLEECAIGAVHSLDAFNFLSGVLFLVVFATVSLVAYFKIKYNFNESITLSKPAHVLHYLMVVLLIISIIVGICDIVYSLYIASQVYGQFDEFRQGQVNCSSSVYYSSFVSVVIVFNYTFVVLGLAVFLYFTFHHIVNIRSQNSIEEN